MKRHTMALLLTAAALAACGGKQRPPVLTTASGGEGAEGTTLPRKVQPVETGLDVQPVRDHAPSGEDFLVSDPSSEAGPLADIHFDYDRADLTDEARSVLERHALWLQSHRAARVTIEGHCDERGTIEYNLALGEQRARAAMEYLLGLGVAADRLRTVSYGKERPLDPSASEAAWARNRRAHFVVSR